MKERMATFYFEVFENYAKIWVEVDVSPISVYLESVEITYTQSFNIQKCAQKVCCSSHIPIEVHVVANTLFI